MTVKNTVNLLIDFPANSWGVGTNSQRNIIESRSVYGGLIANYVGNSVAINAGVYTQFTTIWTSAMPVRGGVTANATTGVITVPITADYEVKAHISGSCDDNNKIVHAAVFVEGVESAIESNRKYTTGGDVGSQSFGGIISMNAGDTVDLRVNPHETTSIVPEHTQLYVEMKG